MKKILLLLGIVILGNPAMIFGYTQMDSSEKWHDEDKGLRTKITAGIAQMYDTNITYVHHDRLDDFMTNLSMGVDMNYHSKTDDFNLQTQVTQQFFASHHDFENISEDLTLDYKKELSEYNRLRLNNTYVHTDEPRSFQDAFGRSAGRYQYYLNRFSGEYVQEFYKQFSGLVKYSNEFYSPRRQDIAGSVQNKMGVELDYAPDTDTVFLTAFDYANREFHPGHAINAEEVTLGIKQFITKQLQLETRVGADFLSHNDRDVTEPEFFLSLTNPIFKTAEVGFTFIKKHDSNAFTEDIFDFWQVSWSLSKHILKRLKVAATHFYGDGEYSISNDKETFQGVRLGLFYTFAEQWLGNITYSYEDVDSNNTDREYVKNTIYMGLRWEF